MTNAKFINVVLMENIPQFLLQIFYVIQESSGAHGSGISELSPMLFISMMFSVLSIFMSGISQIGYICQLLFQPKRLQFAYQTTIDVCLTISSKSLHFHHGFADKTCEKCIIDTLHTYDNLRSLFSRTDILIENEVYYLDSRICTVNEFDVYFQLTIYSNNLNDGKLFYHNIQQLSLEKSNAYQMLKNALIKTLHLKNSNDLQIKIVNLSMNSHDDEPDQSSQVAIFASKSVSVDERDKFSSNSEIDLVYS